MSNQTCNAVIALGVFNIVKTVNDNLKSKEKERERESHEPRGRGSPPHHVPRQARVLRCAGGDQSESPCRATALPQLLQMPACSDRGRRVSAQGGGRVMCGRVGSGTYAARVGEWAIF